MKKFSSDPSEWENKRITKPLVGAGDNFRLKTQDYDPFYVHWIAINRLGKLEDALTLKKIEDWNKDYQNCIWFKQIDGLFEPVYIGNPLDPDFPDDNPEFFIQMPILFTEDLEGDEEE